MDLTDKVVVFVGALGSIGYEASKEFMKRKLAYFIILDAIDNPEAVKTLQSLNTQCKVKYIKFDITNREAIKSTIASIVAETKYIDVLINGAGILKDRLVEKTIEVNLTGLINTTLEALPHMNKQAQGRGGLILNIASVFGLEPCPGACVYGGTKHGVVGFTRSLADPHYYQFTGVAVTALCPGLTVSPLKNGIVDGHGTFDYSAPLVEAFMNTADQPPEFCGQHLVRIVESNKNGSFWISDLKVLREVEFKVQWIPKYVK